MESILIERTDFMLIVKEVIHMATFNKLGRYNFELTDTEYNKITKKLDGFLSKSRKRELQKTGKKMREAARKFQIEVR